MSFSVLSFSKSSFRSLMKSRLNTFISLAGLGIGFLASMTILQYNFYEGSFDNFHRGKERVYRVVDSFKNSTTSNVRASSFYFASAAFKTELSGVENSTHFALTNCVMKKGDNLFREDKVVLTNSNYFDIFSVPLVAGSCEDIDGLNAIVLTESIATKYFGTENAVGELLEVQSLIGMNFTGKVVAVVKDLPPNTHLTGDIFMSMNKYEEFAANGGLGTGVTLESVGWRLMGFYTYIKVYPNTNIKKLNSEIAALLNGYRKDINAKLNQQHELFAQPLLSIHTTQGYENELTPSVNKSSIKLFYVIAVLILIMAWINYINLSTARAINRAREVGMRKVLGAGKKQLMVQFLFESLLLSLFALILACTVLFSLGSTIESILDKQIFFNSLQNIIVIGAATLTIIFGSLFAGLYPAFVLTSYSPITVLKGHIKYSGAGVMLKKSLVLFQFFVALALLSALFIVKSQLNFMMTADIGADINQVLNVRLPGVNQYDAAYAGKVQLLKEELITSNDIKFASVSSIMPGIRDVAVGTAKPFNDDNQTIFAHLSYIDKHYIDVFGLKVIAGRGFSEEFTGDGRVCIINRKAAESFGYKSAQDALNQYLLVRFTETKIVGVIENFSQLGVQAAFEPTVMELDTAFANGTFLNIKLGTENLEASLAHINSKFKTIFPEYPYAYTFLDQTFTNQYNEDKKFSQVFTFFTVVAVFIACLGLLGLSAYMADQRKKEVSIRKVLGSGLLRIFILLNKEYLILSSVSFVIAAPVIYYLMTNWLQSFYNRISIEIWMLVIPYCVIQIIVLAVTVSQTYATAITNPTKTLKEQ
jgi:putative ABC transport system permease protein